LPDFHPCFQFIHKSIRLSFLPSINATTYSLSDFHPCFHWTTQLSTHLPFYASHPSIHQSTVYPHIHLSVSLPSVFPITPSSTCVCQPTGLSVSMAAGAGVRCSRYYGREVPGGDEALVPSIRLSRIVCFTSIL
jgi:hypothetical protein